MSTAPLPPDYRVILDTVTSGSSVLDLGCGTGELLALLQEQRRVKGQGIEIDHQAIYACVEKGLSVIHGDIDSGLADYGTGSFDYVIMDQCLQQVQHPDTALTEALRIGRRVIVAFPNFTHIRARLQFFFMGRAPVTPSLPFEWYNTPNSHFLSIADFKTYCRSRNLQVEAAYYLAERDRVRVLPNVFARVGLFVLRGKNGS